MNDHIKVPRQDIERSNGSKVAGDDHLQQILESRSCFRKILSLRFGSRSHHDHDPALEEEIDDVSAEESRPSRDENAAACGVCG